jgi:cystathionine beta-lyase/cystathionine gamma-synthase
MITVLQPLFTATYEMGAHLVVHSATKLMDGQGRVLGGVTVGDPELIQKSIVFRLTGPSCLRLMLGYYQKFRDFSDSFR